MTPNDYRSLLRWCCYMLAGSVLCALVLITDTVPYVALGLVALACAGGVAYALRDPELDVPLSDVEVWEQANTPSRHEPCEYVEKLEPWQQEWRCRLHREDAA